MCPVVHMFHTLGVMKKRVARTPGEAEGDYRLKGEKEVLRLADRIVAATPAELAQLQWLYQADTRKVVIIPPGVDISRFYPIPRTKPRRSSACRPASTDAAVRRSDRAAERHRYPDPGDRADASQTGATSAWR